VKWGLWREELGDDLFGRLKAALRIRYAVDKGFGPGLWRPSEVVESRPQDRTFGGRLKNLGVAVGVNILSLRCWSQGRRKGLVAMGAASF
jgi:hypothetical protein